MVSHIVAWHWPWIIFLVGLYAFALPWIVDAILLRYFVDQDYNAVLTGLDKTDARKVTMVGHMGFGAICLLLGPFQFLPVIRRKWPRAHRWMGRVYVSSALACSMLGLIFVFLKRFVLVGGVNMGLAFFVSGVLFGASVFLTAYFARRQLWTRHRNWSIRAYSQILAPMMYRYFYLLLGGLQLYPDNGEIDCNERDVCFPFTNAFDSVHAWTYYLIPLGFAEGIVYCLPKIKESLGNSAAMKDSAAEAGGNDAVDSGEAHEDDMEAGEAMVESNMSADHADDYRGLNLLGVCGALFSVVATCIIYVTSIAGVNSVST